MPFSHYLYGKVKEAKTDLIVLILNEEEIKFLKNFNISFSQSDDIESESRYIVNSKQLKDLFCF